MDDSKRDPVRSTNDRYKTMASDHGIQSAADVIGMVSPKIKTIVITVIMIIVMMRKQST